MRMPILLTAILIGLGISPALPLRAQEHDREAEPKSARCEVLLRSIDQMREASRQMLAQFQQKRERAESLSGSLDSEHRQALNDYLQNQETRLKAVLDGLHGINCSTGSIRGGTSPPPQ